VKPLVGPSPGVGSVAPQLAHDPAGGGSWKYGTTLGPNSRKARHGDAGRAYGGRT
jgi:hypothetical protein